MNLLPPPRTLPPGSTVWAYLRDSGGEKQDRSITRQLEAIEAYCRQYRLQLIHVYKDEARSGTTTAGRDDFYRMITQSDQQDASRNPTGLLLWSFSRFGRNLDDVTFYKARLRRNNIIIHSLTDQIPDGPYSRFVETLVDITNEERSRQTSIDAKDGLRSIVSQGAVPGTPPLGFKRVPISTINPRTGEERKNHRWEPDKKLLPRIRRAFKMRATGSTLNEIHNATRLYGSINSYRTFFTNKLYIGILEFGDMVIENYCDPIIDMKTWNTVQKRIEDTAQHRFGERHPKRVNSVYLLSGLIKCAKCGAPMNGNTVSRDSIHGRDEAYRCSRSKRRAGCDAGRISRRRIEDLVLSTLSDYILIPDNLVAVQELAVHNQEETESERAERKEDLQDDIRALSREIANITKAIAAAGHSDALITSLQEKESSKAQKKKELAELEIPIQPVPRLSQPQIETGSKRLVDRLKNEPLEKRRELLRELVHEVTAERSGKHIFALITYYYPPPFDLAPTDDGKMLPITHAPVGALRYRQTFSYPVVSEETTRSK
ncbi:MAG TPA: recombinase family protein [Anaerolineales bacterium]|nr:recombinase family protein [Anaerolineales bacterium]